jgi:hypothetical protein
MEDITERQENEVTALKSIYSNFFTDFTEEIRSYKIRTKNYNKFNLPILVQKDQYPYFKITLFPINSHSREISSHTYVQIDLNVKFTPFYPKE